MATVPAPPGLQPWIRDTDRRIGAAERAVKSLQQSSTRTRLTPAYAEVSEAVVSPQGAFPEWNQLMSAEGPDISGQGNGERVKVTVSAVCEGWRSGTAAAQAGALMRATFQPVDTYRQASRADDLAGIGLGFAFDYPAGSSQMQRFSGSFSRIMNLPLGPYTVRSEYLYTQSVTGIAIRWSQRTLMIEPF